MCTFQPQQTLPIFDTFTTKLARFLTPWLDLYKKNLGKPLSMHRVENILVILETRILRVSAPHIPSIARIIKPRNLLSYEVNFSNNGPVNTVNMCY